MNLQYKILTIVLLFIFIPTFSLNTYAVTKKQKVKVEQAKQKQKQIQQKIKQIQQKKKEVAKKIYIVTEKKNEIEEKLETTESKLKDTQYKYTLAQKQVKVATISLDKAKLKYSRQLTYAQSRIRNMYKYKQVDYLNFLLDAKDLNNFTRRAEYLNYIATKDSDILQNLKEKKQEVDGLRKQYVKKREQISDIEKSYKNQKSQFEKDSETLTDYKQQLQKDKATLEREEDAMERQSQQITAWIQSLYASQPKRARMGSGRLTWPVPSCHSLSSPFGWRIHPISGRSRFHSGIDIPASYGSAIIAPENGVVISAGWQGGYGKAIIIDHGGGLSTLFGHTSAIYVSTGQTVKRGQTIAVIGSTGYSTGPHLHFEVRQNGNPSNPIGWM